MTPATQSALTAYRSRPNQSRSIGDSSARGERGRILGAATMKARSEAYVRELRPIVEELRDEGLSQAAIAAVLNAEGRRTPRGLAFTKNQVHFILSRPVA